MHLSPQEMNDLDEYFDLGDYQREVTTTSNEAKIWFNRGLVWCYAFNHEEAVLCFKRAIELDPECAMAYWGISYAQGPNYNKTWAAFDANDLRASVSSTFQTIKKAQKLAYSATKLEKMLIDALSKRYQGGEVGELSPAWNYGYAEAMRVVYEEFPHDLDVAVLYAESLMNLTPWKLWDQITGRPARGSQATRVREIFDRSLKLPGGRTHPGLLHFYIHLMEMSSSPEDALEVAERLGGLVPDAGHLHHMPSHLHVLCGDYERAIVSNTEAIAADERYASRRGAMNFYTLYRAHDYHFRIYAAMFAGQSHVALQTVRELEESIPEGLLRVASPPMADWLEGFLAMRVHVYIRFGRWEEILDMPFPRDDRLYCVTTAMQHYARGVALAALGKVSEAEAERDLFDAALERVPPSRTLFNNTCLDILNIAASMLRGELEYRKGNYQEAFAHLRNSIEADDALPYDEPWGWMQPTRHAYGALLLEQGKVEEAAATYEADLGVTSVLPRAQQHPGNVWALHGYHECLRLLGRVNEAAVIGEQLEKAAAVADIPIVASCFCRLSAVEQSANDTCCNIGRVSPE